MDKRSLVSRGSILGVLLSLVQVGYTQPTEPIPYDGAASVYSEEGVTFAWQPVAEAVSYQVYLGTQGDELDLIDTVTTTELLLTEALVRGKVYQWRVDSTLNDDAVLTGTQWTFTTLAPVAADPHLLAWYPLDAGDGDIAWNGTGHEQHAELVHMSWDKNIGGGEPGAVVQSQGAGYMTLPSFGVLADSKAVTVQGWFRVDSSERSTLLSVARDDTTYVSCYTEENSLHLVMGGIYVGSKGRDRQQDRSFEVEMPFPLDTWKHLVLALDQKAETMALYLDGVEVFTTDQARLAGFLTEQTNISFGKSMTGDSHLHGYLDQIKVYDQVLTKDQASQARINHPAVAQNPNPRQWAHLYKEKTIELRWQTHPDALAYRLFTGTNPDQLAVQAMSQTTYTVLPTRNIAAAKPFYWQVETVLAEGCVRSPIWQFRLSDISMDDLIKQSGWTQWIKHRNLYNKPVQDMILTDLDEERHSFSQYQGRHLLVNMWAPWCSFCRIELQKLPELRKILSEDELFILANTFRNQKESAKWYLLQHPEITCPVTIHDTGEFPYPFSQVQGIPMNFFIAPDGTLKFAMAGMLHPAQMESIVEAAWPQE